MQFKDLVDSYIIDNFPHSIILVGEDGCGKHTLCNYISSHLQFDCVDISNNLSLDILWESQLNSKPIIYLIDTDQKQIKYQNELLKTLEDYSSINYFILLSTNEKNILPTIINRCDVWRYRPYSIQELELVSGSFKNLKLKSIFHTPGQVLKWGNNSLIDDIQNLCITIFDRIDNANISNILSISNKIDFNNKNSDDKYPIDLFKRILYYISYERCLNYKNNIYHAVYDLTRDYINSISMLNINQQRKFEQYLFRLKILLKNGNF